MFCLSIIFSTRTVSGSDFLRPLKLFRCAPRAWRHLHRGNRGQLELVGAVQRGGAVGAVGAVGAGRWDGERWRLHQQMEV